MNYDGIVLGVGGVGSGVLRHLARRGHRVLGLDRFGIAHDRGSSHGRTRIIRKAYFEHPDYVPLCERAFASWASLEAETGTTLYHETGLLLAGPADGEAIAGARLSAERYGVPIENLDEPEARRRFPAFRFPDDADFVFEPRAGYLSVEACVRAHIEAAQNDGATFEQARVVDWSADSNEVRVRTESDEHRAASLVICLGAYHALPPAYRVLRKLQYWFPAAEAAGLDPADGMPAFYLETGDRAFYGFPRLDGASIKVAEHTGGDTVDDPDHLDRHSHPADVEPVSRFVERHLPGVGREPVEHSVCLYTMSPDGHFVVGRLPGHDNVFVAMGLSGHGFKFTGVLGEALADLVVDGETEIPIEFLAPDRWSE